MAGAPTFLHGQQSGTGIKSNQVAVFDSAYAGIVSDTAGAEVKVIEYDEFIKPREMPDSSALLFDVGNTTDTVRFIGNRLYSLNVLSNSGKVDTMYVDGDFFYFKMEEDVLQSVDLSPIDNQTILTFNLAGTVLSIQLEGGNIGNVDLESIDDHISNVSFANRTLTFTRFGSKAYAGGVEILPACLDNQILKYNLSNNAYECADDEQGAGGGSDDWGTQVAETDGAIVGDGTIGNEIKMQAGTVDGQAWLWNTATQQYELALPVNGFNGKFTDLDFTGTTGFDDFNDDEETFSGKFTDLDFTGTTGFSDFQDNTATGGSGTDWADITNIPAGFADNIDDEATSLPWGSITGIPAGFADNIDNVNDADSDPTNEIETWSTLTGKPSGFADNIDNVNDADASPTNEIQVLDWDAPTRALSLLPSGGTVIISEGSGSGFSGKFTDLDFTGTFGFDDFQDDSSTGGSGDGNNFHNAGSLVNTDDVRITSTNGAPQIDIDLEPIAFTTEKAQDALDIFAVSSTDGIDLIYDDNANEIRGTLDIDELTNYSGSLSNVYLAISAGGQRRKMLASLIQDGDDQRITQFSLSNDILSIDLDGDSFGPSLVSLSAYKTTWTNLTGIPAGFADNVDNVNDADADPSNEFQTLTIDGTEITLSNGGGTVDVPTSSFSGKFTDLDFTGTTGFSDFQDDSSTGGSGDGNNFHNGGSIVNTDDIRITSSNGAPQIDIDASSIAFTDEKAQDATGAMIVNTNEGADLVFTNSPSEQLTVKLDINELTTGTPTSESNTYIPYYESGNTRKAQLEDIRDGDDQTWDEWSFSNHVYSISLERDNQIARTINLAPYVTTWANLTGIPSGFADGIDNVDDGDTDDTNELQTIDLTSHILSLDNGGGSVDLSVYNTNTDNQVLDVAQLSGNNLQLSLSGDGEANKSIDLSQFLDDTVLSEAQVDAYVANNGYLTSEVDGSTTNEIQVLDVAQLSGNNLQLSLSSDGEATKSIDFSQFMDNTVLSEAQVDGFVANNGYLTSESQNLNDVLGQSGDADGLAITDVAGLSLRQGNGLINLLGKALPAIILSTDNTGTLSGDWDTGGDFDINGTLSKSAGTFKIDHPLDPFNKYLYHSFVESPDMMNIYNGNTVTDEHGYSEVTLPDYFNALNMDFRYQLTPIGKFANAIVWEEIEGNKFSIKTDKPNTKVSWQVTGIRNDEYARKNRIEVEVEKPDSEKGSLLYGLN